MGFNAISGMPYSLALLRSITKNELAPVAKPLLMSKSEENLISSDSLDLLSFELTIMLRQLLISLLRLLFGSPLEGLF